MDKIQINELSEIINRFSNIDGIHETNIPGMTAIRLSGINMQLPTVYTPSLCIIVQGRKQVLLEDERYQYQPSQYLAASVDLPVIGQVTQASAAKPYLCLQINLDARLISELMLQTQPASTETSRGIFIGKVSDDLGDAVLRYARLMEKPQDAPLLSPLIIREIHYRMLTGEHGAAIAQLVIKGSNMQRINSAIYKIKSDYNKPMTVEDMAEIAGMSLSSFHFHFKEVTAMSPLQFQKRLRLTEARKMMLADSLDAASTAYRVGYESASQFSREYSRMFGKPPMRDIESLRLTGAIA